MRYATTANTPHALARGQTKRLRVSQLAALVIMYNVQRCMSLNSTSMARNSSITTCGTMELPRAAMAFFLHPRKGRVRPGIPEESPSSPSQTAATVGKFRHQPCGQSVRPNSLLPVVVLQCLHGQTGAKSILAHGRKQQAVDRQSSQPTPHLTVGIVGPRPVRSLRSVGSRQ